ncbi:hypothetical protein SmJEL517_g04633 [Synchytrium microbalum]|uniref:separase n=1 Tax=Synchytrium microbalum TaxID=1806994 RepID=A0A507BYP1_9FUNG|nr:uncharacterized protein SmJEL517_g04633 [Synchytrium microbalum]TPX32238.1 hypothetical protein SmJEL517_g04633 [Synchytrium microbalum]
MEALLARLGDASTAVEAAKQLKESLLASTSTTTIRPKPTITKASLPPRTSVSTRIKSNKENSRPGSDVADKKLPHQALRILAHAVKVLAVLPKKESSMRNEATTTTSNVVKASVKKKPTIASSSSTTSKAPELVVNSITDVCIVAIQTLDKSGADSGKGILEVERTTSNIATRLTDLGHYDLALKFLACIKSSIMKTTETKSTPPSSKTSTRRVVQTKKEETKQDDCLTFQVESSDPNLAAILSVCLYNATRCWLGDGRRGKSENLCTSIVKPYGMHHWCQRLRALDPAAGSRQADCLYRFFYRVSMTDPGIDPSLALRLRELALTFYVMTSSCTASHFHEHAYKFGMAFEKHCKDDAKLMKVLHAFYEAVASLSQLLPHNGHIEVDFMMWCEHWLVNGQRAGIHANIKTTLDYARSRLDGQKAAPALGHLLAFNIEAILLDFETKKKWDDNQACNIIAEIAVFQDVISSLNETRVIKNQVRAIDGLRRAIMKGGDAGSASMLLLDALTELLDTWKSFYSGDAPPSVDLSKLDRLLVEMLNALARVCPSEAYSYLDRALAVSSDYPDGLRAISSTSYNLGGSRYKSGEFETASKLFQLSCLALQTCQQLVPGDDELQTQVARRLDALATCHASSSDQSAAMESTQAAILALPIRTYAELEKHILFPGKYPRPELLTKLLERLVRAGVYISQTNQRYFNQHVSAIAEYEIKIAQSLSQSSSTLLAQTKLMDLLLEQYSETRNPVRRSRALLERARILRVKEDNNSCIVHIKEAIALLQSQELGEEPNLEAQVSNDLAIANAYYGTVLNSVGKYAAQPFRDALHLWSTLLQSVPTYQKRDRVHVSQALDYFRNVESTYYSIRSLADYFGVLEQPLNRIFALRLLLRVASLRNAPTVATDVLLVLAEMGFVYVSVGFTGRAGLALVNGRKIMETPSCKSSPDFGEAGMRWRLSYSNYLCAIGNLKKGSTIFDEIQESSNLSKSRRDSLQSLAYWVRSSLALAAGSVGNALQDVDVAIKILLRACGRASNVADDDGKAESGIDSFLCQGSQWELVEKFLSLYRSLGHLYVIRGSPLEAEYVYRRGLSLSQRVQSSLAESAFLVALGDVDLRRARLEDSEMQIINGLERQVPMLLDISIVDSTWAKVVRGDLKYRSGDLNEALLEYNEAEHCVDDAIRSQSVTEELDFGTPDKRHSGHVRRSSTPMSSRHSSPRMNNHSPAKGNLYHSPVKVDHEAFILAAVKSEVQSRVGWVLGELGNLGEAEQKIADANDCVIKAPDCSVTRAKLRLRKLVAQLTGGPLFDMFGDSAFSLPWCVPSRPPVNVATPSKSLSKVKSSKNRNIAVLSSLAIEVDEMLEEAGQAARERGRPQLVHDTSHGQALLSIVTSYLGLQGPVSKPKEVAAEAVALLHSSLGLTARREFMDLLRRKAESSIVPWPSVSCNLDLKDKSRNSLLYQKYKTEMVMTTDDFVKRYVHPLPSNYVVVSISADVDRGDLYLTRIEHDRTPALLRLPTRRQSSREGDDEKLSFEGCKEELETIIASSNELTRQAKTTDTKEGKASWWKQRKELDHRLRHLLDDVEKVWLGGFRGFISVDGLPETDEDDDDSNAINEFRAAVNKMLTKAVSRKNSSAAQRAKSVNQARMPELDIGLVESLLRLGPRPDDDACEDAIYHLMDAIQYGGASVEYDEVDLDGMTEDLKNALCKFHHDTDSGLSEDGAFNLDSNSAPTNHLILIIDKYLQSIPWESIPCLRGRSVSRLPSMSFLRDRLVQEKNGKMAAVSSENVSYVLNPSGDLSSTQKEFEGFLASKSWKGTVGKPPTEQAFEDGLSKSDIFIYFGHGGGEQYLRPSRIRRLDQCAVTFLMGCSSGRLKAEGEFDPFGVALDYIFAGSPALVANLWDVTDRDIDKFTKDVLQRWGLLDSSEDGDEDEEEESRNVTLSEAVGRSRDTCTLRYLNGAAPVVYGIPVMLRK